LAVSQNTPRYQWKGVDSQQKRSDPIASPLPFPNIVGTGDRQARRIVSALVDRSVLASESARAGAPRIFSRIRVAMDAWAVPGKDGVSRASHLMLHIPSESHREERTQSWQRITNEYPKRCRGGSTRAESFTFPTHMFRWLASWD
jgi:hypothetical protein